MCGALVPKQPHHPRARRPPGLVGGASLHRIELTKRNAALPRFPHRPRPAPPLRPFRRSSCPNRCRLPGVLALAELFSGFTVQLNIVHLNSPNDRASQLIPMSGEARQFRHNSKKYFTPLWPSMNAQYSAWSVQGRQRQHQRERGDHAH
jgi:hypothetical protein